MKKIITSLAVISMISIGLAGCAPGQNTPGATVVGAATGGLLGAAIFNGSVAGVIGGALVGGVVGNLVGQSMDRQDEIYMQNAIVNTPVDQDYTWTNNRTHNVYIVRPVGQYYANGRICRRYRTRINIGGTWRTAYGRACRMPNGRWSVVQ